MNIDASELVVLVPAVLIMAAIFAFPLWTLVDIMRWPKSAWAAAGRTRWVWFLGILLLWLAGFALGVLLAIFYVLGPRQRLQKTRNVGLPAAGWYANPEGEGERFWDGSAWTDDFRSDDAPTPPGAPTT